jgi:hypothetical protein
MADSSLYAGERLGNRIFKVGRVGFDAGPTDPDANVYVGTFKSERIFPAGPGGLINFRQVSIHVRASDEYVMTVKVFVDDVQTKAINGSPQKVIITNTVSGVSEVTEEIKISKSGSFIQVEITIDSDDIKGIFLIEGIWGHGRIIRKTSGRTGTAT